MNTISPYIFFDGSTGATMSFYKSVFGGELNQIPMSAVPGLEPAKPGEPEKIIHSHLQTAGGGLMASDCHADNSPFHYDPKFPHVSIAVRCESQSEIERIFAALAEGGTIICPVGPAFWGGTFAAAVDRFGIGWSLAFDPNA